MSTTRGIIREAIQQVLWEHVQEPFLLIREAGLQARLWCLLCDNLDPAVVNSQIRAKSPMHQHTREFQTSRVPLELKVGGREKSDIVVFRADRKPRLTCWPAGPTDVVAKVEPDDVAAVIEMKPPRRKLVNRGPPSLMTSRSWRTFARNTRISSAISSWSTSRCPFRMPRAIRPK